MKRSTLICIFSLVVIFTMGQSTTSTYKLRAEYIYGSILNHDTKHVGPLIKGPVMGTELAVEYQTLGERYWHHYLHFPTIGVAVAWLNLGNNDKLGNAFAFYPYINFPLVRNKDFTLSVKAGAGVSLLTKTYQNTNTDSLGQKLPDLTGTNSAIGSMFNVYFAGGGSLEIPLSKGFSLTADYTWNHMSNGSIRVPNTGLNLMNAFVGLKYCPNYNKYTMPQERDVEKLPRRLTTEIIVSGGVRQLYYKDNKFFPIGSVCLAELLPLSNAYRMGVGVDAFYDGAFGEVNSSAVASENETQYVRTYTTADKLTNKLRVGVSWQHEMIIGRLTAGFHFGLYLYDPIKNMEPYATSSTLTQNKPLIYSYDIDKEDGWLYTRASLKYTLSKHIFASIGLKTHLQKAEFIEWGLGYRL
jgi:hypothetical protein